MYVYIYKSDLYTEGMRNPSKTPGTIASEKGKIPHSFLDNPFLSYREIKF